MDSYVEANALRDILITRPEKRPHYYQFTGHHDGYIEAVMPGIA
ncbi:MAG: hypothetical protein Q7T40_10215 [Methylobacter sp.]|nr:hypothetical protein [Methylobacter sp.]